MRIPGTCFRTILTKLLKYSGFIEFKLCGSLSGLGTCRKTGMLRACLLHAYQPPEVILPSIHIQEPTVSVGESLAIGVGALSKSKQALNKAG